jgi:hypothetical protein
VQFDGAAVRLGIAQGSIDMPHAPDPRDFIPENGPTGDFMGDSSEMGQMSQMGQTEEDEGPFDFLDEDTEHGAPVMAPAAQHAAGTFFDV